MMASTDWGVVAALSFFTILSPLALFQMKRIWSGEVREELHLEDQTFIGQLKRAQRRAAVLFATSQIIFVLGAWVMMVIHPRPRGQADALQLAGAFVCASAYFSAGVFGPSIIVLSRPRRLIPPHMRDEMSWRDEIRAGRRK